MADCATPTAPDGNPPPLLVRYRHTTLIPTRKDEPALLLITLCGSEVGA